MSEQSKSPKRKYSKPEAIDLGSLISSIGTCGGGNRDNTGPAGPSGLGCGGGGQNTGGACGGGGGVIP